MDKKLVKNNEKLMTILLKRKINLKFNELKRKNWLIMENDIKIRKSKN